MSLLTMVYFPVPMGTTSLSELEFAPLVWPRNGVGLRTVLELAVAAINIAVFTSSHLFSFFCCWACVFLKRVCAGKVSVCVNV